MSLCFIWTSNYQGVSLPLIYISNLQTDTNIYILRHPTQIIPSALSYIVKHLELVGFVPGNVTFRKHISEMKTWFLRRGYPKNLVESEIKKVKFSHIFNNKSQKRTLKRIPLVITYHTSLNSLGKVQGKTLISYTWMKKLKKCFILDPWFHFEVPGRLVATLQELRCTL